jgi:hypothetical protein
VNDKKYTKTYEDAMAEKQQRVNITEQALKNPFKRFLEFVKRQIVDDIPEHLTLCEFDCAKGQCTRDEWATCERRITKAAGELFPNSPPPKP